MTYWLLNSIFSGSFLISCEANFFVPYTEAINLGGSYGFLYLLLVS